MDTTDPAGSGTVTPGSAIFKTPVAPTAMVLDKSGQSGSVLPPEQPFLPHGSRSGSGSSSRSSSSSLECWVKGRTITFLISLGTSQAILDPFMHHTGTLLTREQAPGSGEGGGGVLG
jgi:hypothetical protein